MPSAHPTAAIGLATLFTATRPVTGCHNMSLAKKSINLPNEPNSPRARKWPKCNPDNLFRPPMEHFPHLLLY
jgi:hypothetical protein